MSDSLQPHGLWPARLLYPWRFSRQEYWSGLPGPPPGDLPDPGIEPTFLMSPALAGGFSTTSATWEAHPSACVSKREFHLSIKVPFHFFSKKKLSPFIFI